jgi:hypothetical protein
MILKNYRGTVVIRQGFLFNIILLVYQLKPGGFFGEKVEACKSAALEWYAPRKDVLAPRWVIGLLKLLSRGDAKVCVYFNVLATFRKEFSCYLQKNHSIYTIGELYISCDLPCLQKKRS